MCVRPLSHLCQDFPWADLSGDLEDILSEHPKGKLHLLNKEQEEKGEENEQKQQTPFSFEDIFDPSLRPRGFDGTWMSGNTYVYRDLEGDVYEVDAESGLQSLIMPDEILTDLDSGTYFVSPGLEYVLIAVGRRQVWRHSYTASYKIFIRSEENPDNQVIDFPTGDLSGEILQFARWGSAGNALSFVYGNNLYYQASPTDEAQQVSFTGQDIYVFNGIPDWVYEEDVIGSSRGHHFSPDSQYIAYVEYNDTLVPLQSWPTYGSKEDVYGQITQIAYPKAGDTADGQLGPISTVKIYVVDVDDLLNPIELEPPAEIANQEGYFYYTRIAWQDNSHAYIHWANRAQNYSVSVLYDVTTGSSQNNNELIVQGGWIDSPAADPWFNSDGSQYITILPQEIEDLGTFPQVALVTSPADDTGEVTFLLSTSMYVNSIVGFDIENNTVYFTSPGDDPTESQIYRVGTPDAAPDMQDLVCLTCDYPASCRYVSGYFSETGKYYIERCGGPAIPSYSLKGLDDFTDVDLENNSDVQARLDEKQLPTRIFYDIDVGGGYSGKAEVFIPYGDTGAESYPLMVYTYAGPNSIRVTKSYPMGSNTANWLTYMKSTHRIVVASVDGRGTINRSDRYRFQMYRSLGTVEIEDQLIAARWFRDQSYVDASQKAAVFGWSYGGFTSAQSLAESTEEEFTCGISVAPVTTKRYYDSAYTERYMAFDLPEDNEAGYNNTDVIQKAAQFQGKDYLLAHGTADDNVHFMHTTQLVRALVEEEVQFRELMYVDENHSIGSPYQSRHLYRALTNFLLNDCWNSAS